MERARGETAEEKKKKLDTSKRVDPDLELLYAGEILLPLVFSSFVGRGSRHGRQTERERRTLDKREKEEAKETRTPRERERDRRRVKKTSLPGRTHLEPVVTSA